MASTTFCDWCGERIEVPVKGEPPTIKVHGHTPGGRLLFRAIEDGFEIHAVQTNDGIDPDCCLGKLETFLAERAAWAHDQEQQGYEWRLVPCGDNQPILGRAQQAQRRRSELSAEEKEKREADSRRWHKFRGFSKEERRAMILDELLETPSLTASEIAKSLEEEDMTVRAEVIRPIVREMFDEGVLVREEERYGKGSRIRFRYSRPTDEARAA